MILTKENKMKYKFSDLDKKLQLIKQSHDQNVAYADAMKIQVPDRFIPIFDLQKAQKSCIKKHNKYYGNTSKYTPH